MKRWALIVAGLYVLMLAVLTVPVVLLAFSDMKPKEAVSAYAAWFYWVGLAVLLLAQLALLVVPVRITSRRPVSRRGLLPTVLAAGLMMGALAGGARAMAQPVGRLEPGYRADLLVLEDDGVHQGDAQLDAAIFGPGRNLVRDVMVGGVWRVTNRRHVAEEAAQTLYRATLSEVLGA